MYYMYILITSDYKYYIGSTQNVEARLKRHNNGGSLYTKSRRPVRLVYQEEFSNRADAIQREKQLKSWKSSKDIDKLIKQSGPVV